MASNKNTDGSRKRPYTLRARARRKEEVHHRITLATVHLHGTVGPARTTVSDIANIAGVRRATVYNHFPTDLDLLDACSTHWFTENPPPDFAPWVEIQDPISRAVVALTAMYEYYDHGQEMLEKVLRDAPLVPALDEILRQKWWPMMEGIIEILAEGWDSIEAEKSSRSEVQLRATFRVALDFGTWQKLVESRLSINEAARLAVGWVESGLAL
jgi:AcrR family transcriptional regulator